MDNPYGLPDKVSATVVDEGNGPTVLHLADDRQWTKVRDVIRVYEPTALGTESGHYEPSGTYVIEVWRAEGWVELARGSATLHRYAQTNMVTEAVRRAVAILYGLEKAR